MYEISGHTASVLLELTQHSSDVELTRSFRVESSAPDDRAASTTPSLHRRVHALDREVALGLAQLHRPNTQVTLVHDSSRRPVELGQHLQPDSNITFLLPVLVKPEVKSFPDNIEWED